MADTSTKKSGKGWRVRIRKMFRWPHAKKKDKEETTVLTKLFPIDETGHSHQVSSPFTITTKKEDNASNTDSSFIAEKSKLTHPNSLFIPADCFGPSENIVTQPTNDLAFTETRLSLSSPPGIFENDCRQLVASGQKAIENPPKPLEAADVSSSQEKVIEGAKVVQEESSTSKKTEKLQWVTLETETKFMPESENAEVVELPYLSIESEENEEVHHADLNEKLLESQGDLSAESKLADNSDPVNEVHITTNVNDNAQHTTLEEEGIIEEIHDTLKLHSQKKEAHLEAKPEAEGSPEHQEGKEVQKSPDESIETFETAIGSLGEQASVEQSSACNPEPSTTQFINNMESLGRIKEKERESEAEPTLEKLPELQRECSPSYLEKLDFLEENILSLDSGEFLKPQEKQDEFKGECNLPSATQFIDNTESLERIKEKERESEAEPTLEKLPELQRECSPSYSEKLDSLEENILSLDSGEFLKPQEKQDEFKGERNLSPTNNSAYPTEAIENSHNSRENHETQQSNISNEEKPAVTPEMLGESIYESSEQYGPSKSEFTQDIREFADCQKEDFLDSHGISFESPSKEHQLKTEPMEQIKSQEGPDQNHEIQQSNISNEEKPAVTPEMLGESIYESSEHQEKYEPSKLEFTQDIRAFADCQKENFLDSHDISFESPSEEHQLKTEPMEQIKSQEGPDQNPAQPVSFESDQVVQYNQHDNMVNKKVSMDNLFSPSQTVPGAEIFENQVKLLDDVPTAPLEELIETMDVQEADNLTVQNSQIFEKESNKLDTSPKSDFTNETYITSSENQESVSADQGFESDDNNQEIGNLAINYQQATWTDLQQRSQYYFQNNLDHQYNQLSYNEQHYIQQVCDPQMLLTRSPSNPTYYDSSWMSHDRYLTQDWQENALENNDNTCRESVPEINNQSLMFSIENDEYLNMGRIEQNPTNHQLATNYSELHQSFSCAETFETLIDPIMTFPQEHSEHDRPVSREAAWHQVPALGDSDKFWPEVESLPSEPDLRTVHENSVLQTNNGTTNYTYQAPNPLIITHEIVYESQMYPTEENQWVDHSENTFGQMEEGNVPTSQKPETFQKGFSKNEASPSEKALDESTSVFESKYSWHTAAVSFNDLDEMAAANEPFAATPLPEQSNPPIQPSPEQELPKVLAEGEIVVEAEKLKQDGKPVTRDASQHQGDVDVIALDDQQSTEQNSIFASPPNLSTENRSEKFFFGPDPLHYSK